MKTKQSVSLALDEDFARIMNERASARGITPEQWLEGCWRLSGLAQYLVDEVEGRHARHTRSQS